MPLYHCAPIPLENGSIIQPGNWGRVLKTYVSGRGDLAIAFRERVLEDVRLAHFPHKPSRLSSIFLIPELNDMLEYWGHNNPTAIVYEVELVTRDCRTHSAPWLFDFNDDRQFYFDGTAEMARLYWGDHPVEPRREIVGESSIRVVKRWTWP